MSERRAFIGHTRARSATFAGIFNSRQFPTALFLVVSAM
jgi:hypothetical protein